MQLHKIINNPFAAFTIGTLIAIGENQLIDRVLLPYGRPEDIYTTDVVASYIVGFGAVGGTLLYLFSPHTKSAAIAMAASILFVGGSLMGRSISQELTYQALGFNWEDGDIPKPPFIPKMNAKVEANTNG